jgi:WD40 repeat protein
MRFSHLLCVSASALLLSSTAFGDLLVVDHPFNTDVVDLYNNVGSPVSGGNPTLLTLLFASGVAVDSSGAVYVDTGDPQTIGSSSVLASVFKYTYSPATGQLTSSAPFVPYDGTAASVFNPEGMKFGAGGALYIADLGGNGVVHSFSSTGSSITTYSPSGNPIAVAFSPVGNLYAATSQGIEEYNSNTQSFSTIVLAATGGPNNPGDVAFGPDGKLYVLDISSGAPTLFEYNADGSNQVTLGAFPTLFQPSAMAFGPDGHLYISGLDEGNATGEVLRADSAISSYSVFISGLSNPGFIAFTNASSVPEPASLAGLGAGVLVLLSRRRTGRRQGYVTLWLTARQKSSHQRCLPKPLRRGL